MCKSVKLFHLIQCFILKVVIYLLTVKIHKNFAGIFNS